MAGNSDEVKLEARVLFELDQNPENNVVVKSYTGIEERKLQKEATLKGGYLYYSKSDLLRVCDASGRVVLIKELKGEGRLNLKRMVTGKGIYFISIEGKILKWIKID